MELTEAQQRALDHVAKRALSRSEDARALIAHVLRMSDISTERFGAAKHNLGIHAHVALHFHPDRPQADGSTILEGLLESGIYKSQFETGLSSGSVSAHPGGARDTWERELFGGAYQAEDSGSDERPKYGALDVFGHPHGPAPRFGSCYLLLRPDVNERCTFTYLDSFRTPDERGTLQAFDDIWGALLAECFEREAALGEQELRPPRLIAHLLEGIERLPERMSTEPSRNLDHYIEAQVHGALRLDADVACLCADTSFRDTSVGQQFKLLCAKNNLPLCWVPGFSLKVAEVPTDFRGPTMPSLAERIASEERVDAHCIGLAAQALHADPVAWSERGEPAQVLQELKLLWHCLVRYGEARE